VGGVRSSSRRCRKYAWGEKHHWRPRTLNVVSSPVFVGHSGQEGGRRVDCDLSRQVVGGGRGRNEAPIIFSPPFEGAVKLKDNRIAHQASCSSTGAHRHMRNHTPHPQAAWTRAALIWAPALALAQGPHQGSSCWPLPACSSPWC